VSVHSLNVKTGAETALAQQFAALPPNELRRVAFAAFEREGLPGRRDEAWHYTDLRARLTEAAAPTPAPDAARLQAAGEALAALPRLGGMRLVLVDGRWVASLCDPPPGGLTVVPTPDAPEPDEAVVALNVAFTEGALRIGLPPGETSLEIVHLDGPGAIYSRLEIFIPARARATVVERFEGGTAETQRNAMATLGLGEAARCDWTTVIGDDAGLHLETRRARLAGDAELNDFGFVSGGALVRRQLDASHQAAGAKIALAGLSLIDGTRHADTTLTVRHTAPRGQSREYFRHIVADSASGVYQGKVIVAPHAQKTDGGMKSQALLLSPAAQMSNKPELEIFADDVVCGHGATVGALDPQHIFYLRSRGIPEREAEAMLLEAFGAEAIERVADETVSEALRERLRAWLKGRAA
jgi:Fe-S cluster assembly protein SufD